MNPRFYLRISAALLAIHATIHTIGAFNTHFDDPKQSALFDAMRALHFDAMGWDRTPWDFFHGLGLLFGANLGILALFSWQVGSLCYAEPAAARPLIATLLLANVLILLLAWTYFFIVPVALTMLVILSLSVALLISKRTAA